MVRSGTMADHGSHYAKTFCVPEGDMLLYVSSVPEDFDGQYGKETHFIADITLHTRSDTLEPGCSQDPGRKPDIWCDRQDLAVRGMREQGLFTISKHSAVSDDAPVFDDDV